MGESGTWSAVFTGVFGIWGWSVPLRAMVFHDASCWLVLLPEHAGIQVRLVTFQAVQKSTESPSQAHQIIRFDPHSANPRTLKFQRLSSPPCENHRPKLRNNPAVSGAASARVAEARDWEGQGRTKWRHTTRTTRKNNNTCHI